MSWLQEKGSNNANIGTSGDLLEGVEMHLKS